MLDPLWQMSRPVSRYFMNSSRILKKQIRLPPVRVDTRFRNMLRSMVLSPLTL
jgi:hypothetical protein